MHHQQKDCNCFRGIYKLLCFEPPFVNFISPQLSKYLIHCPNLDERTDKTLITASHLPLHKKNNKRVSWNVELLLHNFTIWVYCLWQMLPQSDCIVSAHVSPWVLGGIFFYAHVRPYDHAVMSLFSSVGIKCKPFEANVCHFRMARQFPVCSRRRWHS